MCLSKIIILGFLNDLPLNYTIQMNLYDVIYAFGVNFKVKFKPQEISEAINAEQITPPIPPQHWVN